MSEQTNSQKLLADCDHQIARLQELKNLIVGLREQFDSFRTTGSVGCGNTDRTVFLHEPPDDVKIFCRAIGGKWKKERNSRNGFDYRSDGGLFDFIIFDAEKDQQSEEVEL